MALFQRPIHKRFLIALAALMLAAWSSHWPALADSKALLPDLGLNFSCPQNRPEEIEAAIERFLNQHDFKVLNLGQLQRAHKVPTAGTMMTSLDDKNRIIEVHALVRILGSYERVDGDYALSLITAPPTKRVGELEETIMKFVTDELHCTITRLARHDNDADTIALYQSSIESIKDMFHEADELSRQRKL